MVSTNHPACSHDCCSQGDQVLELDVNPVHGKGPEAIKRAKAKAEMEAAHTGRKEYLAAEGIEIEAGRSRLQTKEQEEDLGQDLDLDSPFRRTGKVQEDGSMHVAAHPKKTAEVAKTDRQTDRLGLIEVPAETHR